MVDVVKGKPMDCKVGKPKEGSGFEPTCAPFSEVTHTTHVIPAIDVLRQRKLTPGLVYDDSHLNKHRIPVVWLSPNHWHLGYRYGNVQFAYPFADLVADRRAYWVEIAKYRIHAPRILLTDQDRDGHPDLIPYDPTTPDGPWWFDGTTHYRNGDVCLEFMVEGELPLLGSSGIAFVGHHASFCCATPTNPSACRELGASAEIGAGRFLARIAAEGVSVSGLQFQVDDLAWKCSALLMRVASKRAIYGGAAVATDAVAGSFVRAAFGAYANYCNDEHLDLVSLFSSQDEAENACWRVLATALGRTVAEITPADP